MRIGEIGTVRRKRSGPSTRAGTASPSPTRRTSSAIRSSRSRSAADATERLRFATGVTNAFTRHPAALANVAVTVQETSGGRFVLGIGRGDTALFHLGPQAACRSPTSPRSSPTCRPTSPARRIDCDGHPSRLQWLDRCRQPKVPLDIAVSGPRMIEFAARIAERVTLAVGADPDRVAWALDLARKAAADAGRDPGRDLVRRVRQRRLPSRPRRRRAASSAARSPRSRTSRRCRARPAPGWPTPTASRRRGRPPLRQQRAPAATPPRTPPRSNPEFVDRFAVVGPPDVCTERLLGLVELGIERFVITGPSFGASGEHRRTADELVTNELLPALRCERLSSRCRGRFRASSRRSTCRRRSAGGRCRARTRRPGSPNPARPTRAPCTAWSA